MDERLSEFTEPHYWTHLTVPDNLPSIEQTGIQSGYSFTEEQLFASYFPDQETDDVVASRSYAEKILERVRSEVYPGESSVSPRGQSVALWPSVEAGYEMRSAVLGDSVDFGMVVVDAREIQSHKLVLSEYQLVCQVMMNASAYQGFTDEEVTVDELVAPALRYWESAMLTNQWVSVEEQAEMYELPEIHVAEGVAPEAIVWSGVVDAAEYEESDAPPTVTPK